VPPQRSELGFPDFAVTLIAAGSGLWPEPDCLPAHRIGCNVLFADSHVAPFQKFDERYMTFHPQERGKEWHQVR
jgi:prepilin-type processing-associated H-X9-DG protein